MPRQQLLFKDIRIVIEPFGKDNGNKPFVSVDLDVLNRVMLDLTASEFKLWMYLSSNKNGYEFHYSVTVAESFTGLSRSTLYDQWKHLVAKGYIVENSDDTFLFYQLPQRLKNQNL